MRLRPDLELLPLDDDLVVFSEETQCLVGFNSSAAFVFRKLQEGVPASEIAQALASEGIAAPEEAARWVTTTLDALASNSMLADGRAPKVLSKEASDEGQDLSGMPPYAPFTPAAERHYRLLDTCALLRFTHSAQVRLVDAVIGHLAVDSCSASVTMEIQGVKLDDRHLRSNVYRNGEPVGYATRLSRLGPVVKGALWQSAVNAHDYLFYLHAGVVGTGKSCVLLPAAAGSGKSSLTAALTHGGLLYFSDEVALIEPGTFHVGPMPLALCVKSTGWDVMARYYPEVSTVPTHERNDGKIVRYLAPPAEAMHQKAAPVSHIIFPRYDGDGPTEINPIARSEALRRLMDECLALSQRLNRNNVADLIRWIAGIDCYALRFSSLEEGAELVAQVVKRSGR